MGSGSANSFSPAMLLPAGANCVVYGKLLARPRALLIGRSAGKVTANLVPTRITKRAFYQLIR